MLTLSHRITSNPVSQIIHLHRFYFHHFHIAFTGYPILLSPSLLLFFVPPHAVLTFRKYVTGFIREAKFSIRVSRGWWSVDYSFNALSTVKETCPAVSSARHKRVLFNFPHNRLDRENGQKVTIGFFDLWKKKKRWPVTLLYQRKISRSLEFSRSI